MATELHPGELSDRVRVSLQITFCDEPVLEKFIAPSRSQLHTGRPQT